MQVSLMTRGGSTFLGWIRKCDHKLKPFGLPSSNNVYNIAQEPHVNSPRNG